MSDNNELGRSVRSRANSEDKSGRTPIGEGRGKNRRPSEKLVLLQRNSLLKVPGSIFFYGQEFRVIDRPADAACVFFGTSGVPGDGCAAESSAAEILWPVDGSVVHVRGVVFPRAHRTDGVNVRFIGPHGTTQLVVRRADIIHVDAPHKSEPTDWRSFCATGEELG